MSTYNAFELSLCSGALPFIWGSPQDVSGQTFVANGLPYMVVNAQPPTKYVYDNLGRLQHTKFPGGKRSDISYDLLGNRISVVTS